MGPPAVKKMRIFALWAVLVAVAGLVGPQASFADGSTTVIYVGPVDRTGHLDSSRYAVTSFYGGAHCSSDSATGGSFAYRCVTDDGFHVLDPCFAGIKGPWSDFAVRMFCVPFATSTTVIDVTAPVVEDVNHAGTSPVAWRLNERRGTGAPSMAIRARITRDTS